MLETTTEEAPAWADVKESYDYLLHFALTSDTHIARDIAAILLNSAVQKVSGTEIEVSRLRYHLRCLMVRPPHKVSLQQLADARYSLLTR